jgi:nucleoside-diphosphate-sugar epimerase
MILVTGGNGFVGKNVCAALQARSDVLALDKKCTGPHNKPVSFPMVQCDLSDKDALARVFATHSIDTIVHLASLLNTASSENPSLASEVNVGGSVNLFELASSHDVKRIVYGSSITVYGSVTEARSRGVSEEYPAAPEDVYGGSKRYVEILGAAYQTLGAFEFVSVRLASIIGPGSASLSSPWRSDIFEKLRLNHAQIEVPFARHEALPLVHIDDAVSVAVRLVETEETAFSVYNSPSQTWTFAEMAEHVTSVNPQIEFVFGQAKVEGHPYRTDASRFSQEFGLCTIPLEDRLRFVGEKTEDVYSNRRR